MYFSNRDIKWAIRCGQLTVDPTPEHFNSGYDETSIDLHLGPVTEVAVWDIGKYAEECKEKGVPPEVGLGSFNYAKFSEKYLAPPSKAPKDNLVFSRGEDVIVKPYGFLLWMTKEKIGTEKTNPNLICFVNAKSTRARTGIIVHLTAPTIHAGWKGKIELEIANFGPFHLVLRENDVIAQLTVAQITNPPDLALKAGKSQTADQEHATGSSSEVEDVGQRDDTK